MHPQKCAGGSLSNVIKKHFHEELLGASKEGELIPGCLHNGQSDPRLYAHPNFSDILDLTNKPLDKYFKFAVTRNTWDRVVSMYFHVKKHMNYDRSFDDFVLLDGISGKHFFRNFHMKPRITLDNQYIIDFAIRYENYEKDVDYVMNRLGVQNYNLDHCTQSTDRNGLNYRTFYNQQTTDFVYNVFKWEIDKFNYIY
jgi:hypothetical protein